MERLVEAVVEAKIAATRWAQNLLGTGSLEEVVVKRRLRRDMEECDVKPACGCGYCDFKYQKVHAEPEKTIVEL
jgi:hypothetical protein